jgi:hypothetical protein
MPKRKFNLSLESGQLTALKRIEARTGARISEQIRRAVDLWLSTQGETAPRMRMSVRKRA